MSKEFRPIGYWLKELDRRIEESFTALLAGAELSRRHWQVLDTLARGPAGQEELDRAVEPFLTERVPSTEPVVGELAARGWVRPTDSAFELTDAGRAAHAALRAKVARNRRRVTEGITAQEYASTVGVLERMAANLASG